MAGPTGNPYAGNRHADVLNEEPTDEAAKLRLVEEVKNRAKGAFSQKDMPSAELLYGKAIKLLDSVPGKAEAPLFSNRSMVRLNLNKVEGALEDANKCLEIDPKFVKAWHRKAQALLRLNEWDEAIVAAKKGAELDAANKAFPELIEKAEKDKAADAEDKAKLKRDAQDARVELHNASTARAPPVKKEKKVGEEGATEGDEENGMRGYKKTSDGRTTSYFHTEISDEAKKLIAEQGFGKPQKIEGQVQEVEAKGGGSKWNQAGTYEEKGMTKWVQDRVQALLCGVSFAIPSGAGGGTITTTAVHDVKGDASIASSRGKRRHVMDLSFEVDFEAKVGDGVGKGKVAFSDVTTITDDSPEISVEIDGSSPPAVREVMDAFVKPAGQGLQPLLTAEIRKLIEEYKEK